MSRVPALIGLLLATTAAGCATAPPAAPVSPVPIAAVAPPPASLPTPLIARALVPATPAVAPLEQLRRDIAAAVQRPGVQRGIWGIAVHSLTRDERLFELNARSLLVPASAAKIVSAAAAGEAVGWDYRFETTLRGTGPIVDGTLHGDLIVVGSGDPSIGGRGGDDVGVFSAALRAAGIRRIDGRVIGDDDAVEEPRPQLAWAWDDLGYTTGAIFGALNVGENRMTVTVGAARSAGGPTTLTVEPQAASRPLLNRTVTGAAGSAQLLWPEQRPGEAALTIAGSMPAGAAPARLNVSSGNPTLWFASVLRNRLQRDGIVVTGDAVDVDDVMPKPDTAAASVLYAYRSPPLSALVQPLLKDSINLYGEAALRLNAAPGSFPTNDAALDGLRARLASWGIAADAQQIVDGSGLSRRDVITPEALLIVLRRMHAGGPASPFVTGLPLAGVDGSLANRMKDTAAQGNLRAKTGTMSNIRALAGYVTSRDGEPLAVVIMVNNFEGPGAAAVQAIDAIAVKLAEFSRGSD